jgi:hypothetical protein
VAQLSDIQEGTRVRLLAVPEWDAPEEIGTVSSVEEGFAYVTVDPEYRDEDDRDGLREIYLDDEGLDHMEVLS